MKQKFYGYQSFIAAIVVMVAFYGIEATLPIMFPFMAETFHSTAEAVGLGMTFSGVVAFIATFASGFIIKKIGLKAALMANMVLIFSSIVVFYFAESITMYYVGSVIKGISGGVYIAVCISALISNWFNARRATLIGLAFMCSSLGSSFFLSIAGFMLETMTWQSTYMILSLGCIVVGLIAAMFVKTHPSQYNQTAKGEIEKTEEGVYGTMTMKKAVKSYAFWVQIISAALISIFILMLPTYAGAMWYEAGMDVSLIGILLTVATCMCALWGVVAGVIADKLGKKIYVIILLLALCASTLVTAFSAGTLNMTLIIISLITLVIANPAFTTMYPTISFEMFAGPDYEKILGFIQGGIQIGLMLMPIVVSTTFALGGGYKEVFMIGAVLTFVCLIALLPIFKKNNSNK